MKFPNLPVLALCSLNVFEPALADARKSPQIYMNRLVECVAAQASDSIDEFSGYFIQRQVGMAVYKVIVVMELKEGHPAEGPELVEIYRFPAYMLGTDTEYEGPDSAYFFHDRANQVNPISPSEEALISETEGQLCPLN